mmetsp:Transcript_115281/g.322225  ORF Transcript_115281/g.322225 Transcript_115281/m.322225 type:complete len:206 (-) Transcript_115281:239-856(-)
MPHVSSWSYSWGNFSTVSLFNKDFTVRATLVSSSSTLRCLAAHAVGDCNIGLVSACAHVGLSMRWRCCDILALHAVGGAAFGCGASGVTSASGSSALFARTGGAAGGASSSASGSEPLSEAPLPASEVAGLGSTAAVATSTWTSGVAVAGGGSTAGSAISCCAAEPDGSPTDATLSPFSTCTAASTSDSSSESESPKYAELIMVG